MHSGISMKVKKDISLSIFLNFLARSEELCAVQCEVTGRDDHGQIEPSWFLIHHTESIIPSFGILGVMITGDTALTKGLI